jgi:hypothetical protein
VAENLNGLPGAIAATAKTLVLSGIEGSLVRISQLTELLF